MLKDVEVRETSPAITGPRRSTSRYIHIHVPKLAKSGSLEINDIANTMYTFQVCTFQVPSSVCAQASLFVTTGAVAMIANSRALPMILGRRYGSTHVLARVN